MKQLRNSGIFSRFSKIISQWTIQREITFTILLCSLLPMILSSIYLYSRINILYEKEVTSSSREVIHQAVSNIENIVEQAELAKKQVIYWSITNNLLDTSITETESYHLENLTADYFRNLRINFPFITGLYVINENQMVYADEMQKFKHDTSMDLIQRIFDPRYKEVITPPQERRYLSSGNPINIITLYKQIRDFNLGGKYGMIQVDLDFRAIESIISEIALSGEYTIYLYNNNPESPYVYSPDGMTDKEIINTWGPEAEDNSQIIINQNIEGTGWSLVAVIPSSSLRDSFSYIRIVSILLVIFLSILSVITGLFVANRITLPLTDVVDKIYRFGQGDFSQKLPQFDNHDLRILADSFNQMTSQIEELMNEAVDREKEKEKAELIALEAQINPHFLYNTLEVVRGISLQKGLPEVSSITKSLACIFRYSINRDKESVSLAEELENIAHYLNVQNHRYIGRFEYKEDIQNYIKDESVLRLMLQPVVENIFKHVIESRRQKTNIQIQACIEDEYLIIDVSNDGSVLSPDQLKGLQKRLEDNNWPEYKEGGASGIGLSNVHKRLCLMNGENRGLEFLSLDEMTIVRLYVKRR